MPKKTKPVNTFAELKRKAKKIKVDFDKETTEAELNILVSAQEAAVAAQAEKDGQAVPPAPVVVASARGDVNDAQAKANAELEPPVVTPAGDTIVQFVVTRNKEKHNLVLTPKGEYQLKTPHGVVTANFETEAEGKRHLENLSRF